MTTAHFPKLSALKAVLEKRELDKMNTNAVTQVSGDTLMIAFTTHGLV